MHANCKHEQCLSKRDPIGAYCTYVYSRQAYSISRSTDSDAAYELLTVFEQALQKQCT